MLVFMEEGNYKINIYQKVIFATNELDITYLDIILNHLVKTL